VLRGTDTLADNDVFVRQTGIADRLLTTEPDAHTWSKDETAELIHYTKLPWRCVVTADRWKLTLFGGGDGELYDLNNDPSEFEKLFDHPEHLDRVQQMTARVKRWQEQYGDTTAPLG
jgi:hypothetical protein